MYGKELFELGKRFGSGCQIVVDNAQEMISIIPLKRVREANSNDWFPKVQLDPDLRENQVIIKSAGNSLKFEIVDGKLNLLEELITNEKEYQQQKEAIQMP